MIVSMIKCDNPRCENVEHAEEGGTAKAPNPPYGWLYLECWGFMGCGPYYNGRNNRLMVCSVDCLEPAVKYRVQETARLERDGG